MNTPSFQLFGHQLTNGHGGPGFVLVGTDTKGEQWEDYLYLLDHGGRGSGKSMAGALRAISYMFRWPRSLGIIAAPTMWMLHDSTFPALERCFTQIGLYHGKGYVYVRDREEITLDNGSRALLRSTEHPDRLRGQDAAWFWIDEARDSPFEAFTNLQGTIRQQGYPHQGWITTTPAGRRHWLCKVFYPEKAAYDPEERPIDQDTGEGRYLAFPAKTRDNPYGGERHYQQLIRTFGEHSLLARQELAGEFVLMEGLVYDNWDPEYHVVPQDRWPIQPDRYLAGVDFGFTNPVAILPYGYHRGTRDRYVLGPEFYESHCNEKRLIEEAQKLLARYPIFTFECDSADPRWISAMRHAGLRARRAHKSVGSVRDPSSGLGVCYRALGQPGDEERQRFWVDPRAYHFIREIEGYAYARAHDRPAAPRNPPEAPQAFEDHIMAAWRYAETFVSTYWDRPSYRLARPQSITVQLS